MSVQSLCDTSHIKKKQICQADILQALTVSNLNYSATVTYIRSPGGVIMTPFPPEVLFRPHC